MTSTPSSTPAQVEDSAIQLQREMQEILQSRVGLHEEFASIFAAAIVIGMREKFGGVKMGARGDLYIPAPSKADRDARIRGEFDGTNADVVCRRHEISRATLYRIVGRTG